MINFNFIYYTATIITILVAIIIILLFILNSSFKGFFKDVIFLKYTSDIHGIILECVKEFNKKLDDFDTREEYYKALALYSMERVKLFLIPRVRITNHAIGNKLDYKTLYDIIYKSVLRIKDEIDALNKEV